MELMRSFHSFMARRRIKNARTWLSTIDIKTQEQFLEWCERENIDPPVEDIFASISVQEPIPSAKPAAKPADKAAATKKKPAARKKSKKKDTAWVPAAERSRVVKGKKPASAPPKRKTIEEDDEEHSKHTTASDS